jgi:cation transport ATPase
MMASGARAMRADSPPGEGERREAARRRKRWLIVAALALVGVVPGFYMGFQHGAAAAQSRPLVWSPTVAALLAGLYLVAVAGGAVLMNSVMDEVERQRGYKAVSFAGAVLMVVYPTWFLLWKGGFVAEPVHWILFVLFWLSLALASLFYRFR